MEKAISNSTVVCFGEMLLDVLPDGPQPGGAPLNVCYHLTRLEMNAGIISRIGRDKEGAQLLDLVHQWGLNDKNIQVDTLYDTSKVIATITPEKEVKYEIVFPVAWDFIELDSSTVEEVKKAPYFVYGSLAARNEVTKKSLFELLSIARFKVFDVNLRPPFFKKDLLKKLLEYADLLKVNESELHILIEMFGSSHKQEGDQVKFIREKFAIPEMLVTKGSRGASYYKGKEAYHRKGRSVQVMDTVGSGDAFLAAFLASHFQNDYPQVILRKATVMGGFIAGKKGGCPPYQLSEYLELYHSMEYDQDE